MTFKAATVKALILSLGSAAAFTGQLHTGKVFLSVACLLADTEQKIFMGDAMSRALVFSEFFLFSL